MGEKVKVKIKDQIYYADPEYNGDAAFYWVIENGEEKRYGDLEVTVIPDEKGGIKMSVLRDRYKIKTIPRKELEIAMNLENNIHDMRVVQVIKLWFRKYLVIFEKVV